MNDETLVESSDQTQALAEFLAREAEAEARAAEEAVRVAAEAGDWMVVIKAEEEQERQEREHRSREAWARWQSDVRQWWDRGVAADDARWRGPRPPFLRGETVAMRMRWVWDHINPRPQKSKKGGKR